MVTVYPSIAGGVWSSSNNAAATVARLDNTAFTANITSVGNGTSAITYTLTTPNTTCTTTSTINVTVAAQATPNAITGANGVCAGSTAAYSTTSTGGVWSTAGYATINSSGVATGSSAGTTAIRYTITNAQGCSATVSKSITVYALPAVPNISFASGTSGTVVGAGGYCKNKTFTLVGNPANGVWSNGGVISVSPSGTNSTTTVVNTGAVTGAASVTYTFTNANGCSNSRTINTNIVNCGSKGIATKTELSNSYSIYPNPARGVIYIQSKMLVGSGKIVVTDLYGKQLKQQTLSMGRNAVDVSNFAKGIYVVNIITDAGNEAQKVVVE